RVSRNGLQCNVKDYRWAFYSRIVLVIKLPGSIEKAVSSFSKLPGVGEKTAMRQVMSLVNWSSADLNDFSEAIHELTHLKFCDECGPYSEEHICDIRKNDSRRDFGVMCVVESINDLLAIERSGNFKGIYHVLGGVLNPLIGIGPDQLKINLLNERVEKHNI